LLKEIQEALDYGPSHVSAYILTVGEDYVQSTLLPSEEEMAEEYLEASSFLQSRGYQAYEVSNFALPGKESRHNLKYWKNQSVAALGPSATGFILTEENGATRYKWEKRETVFEIEKLGTKELNLERLYLGLRTHEGIKPEDFFSAEENELFQGLAQTWVKCGLASWENHHIKATLRGMLVMDSLMDDIFRCVKTF
jgi:oxygen-independent coproporphyrinogen-3 oxidase